MSYFRAQASAYAEFRPDYPEELFEFAASLVKEHELAWDCATGNGQAATRLAKYFARVIATDSSPEQIAHARQHERVHYEVAPAEASPLADGSTNLVTVCQALHWLDRARFYAEVRRVLAPGGALVVTVYGDAHIGSAQRDDDELDAMLQHFNKEFMRDYWPLNRKLVDELFAGVEFPFPLVPAPGIRMAKRWMLAQLVGYVRSWSATARYVERHGRDPVMEFERELRTRWQDAETPREIWWPFRIFAGVRSDVDDSAQHQQQRG